MVLNYNSDTDDYSTLRLTETLVTLFDFFEITNNTFHLPQNGRRSLVYQPIHFKLTMDFESPGIITDKYI